MLNRLLDGFEGKLTSSKWAKLAKTSPDTALRDINDLVARDILVRSLQEEEAPAIGWSFLIRGVDRHRADICVFVELDWVPAAIHQAEDRGHRTGRIWMSMWPKC